MPDATPPQPTAERLVELARRAALENHREVWSMAWNPEHAKHIGRMKGGHLSITEFDTCPHPDCVLVRQPASSTPTEGALDLHRYTITSKGASKGYFRLVEDAEGVWCQWAEVAPLIAEVERLRAAPTGQTWVKIMDFLNTEVPETSVCSGVWQAVKCAVQTLKAGRSA